MYQGILTTDHALRAAPFIKLIPINDQTQDVEPRFEYDKHILAFHESTSAKRDHALDTPTIDDNRETHGCVVFKPGALAVFKDNNIFIIYICKE